MTEKEKKRLEDLLVEEDDEEEERHIQVSDEEMLNIC